MKTPQQMQRFIVLMCYILKNIIWIAFLKTTEFILAAKML